MPCPYRTLMARPERAIRTNINHPALFPGSSGKPDDDALGEYFCDS